MESIRAGFLVCLLLLVGPAWCSDVLPVLRDDANSAAADDGFELADIVPKLDVDAPRFPEVVQTGLQRQAMQRKREVAAASSGSLQAGTLLPGMSARFQQVVQQTKATPAPAPATSSAVRVKVRFHARTLSEIDEPNERVAAALLMFMSWTDPSTPAVTDPKGQEVAAASVWKPDITVVNAAPSLKVRKEKLVVFPNHKVMYTKRIFAAVQVDMDYHWFPFDSHKWDIICQSLTYDSSRVIFEVEGATSDKLENPLWKVKSFNASVHTVTSLAHAGASFSRVSAQFRVSRYTVSYMFQIIMPTIFVMAFVWASFWVDPAAVPARMTLCIMTVLTILFLNMKVEGWLPKIAYMTWMDYYLQTCFALACVGLLIFIAVLFQEYKKARNVSQAKDDDTISYDAHAKWLFLSFFAVFNIIMFSLAVMHLSDGDKQHSASTLASEF